MNIADLIARKKLAAEKNATLETLRRIGSALRVPVIKHPCSVCPWGEAAGGRLGYHAAGSDSGQVSAARSAHGAAQDPG